jgi:hypothetical protein
MRMTGGLPFETVLVQQELADADSGDARCVTPCADVVVHDDNLSERIADALQRTDFLGALLLMRNGEGGRIPFSGKFSSFRE